MSPMTIPQQIITIAICVLGTMLTRFLPFLIFSSKKPTPKYIVYLGKALPCAVFGMLVVYCLKNVSILSGTRHSRASPVEKEYASVHRGRNHCVYAAGAARILTKMADSFS